MSVEEILKIVEEKKLESFSLILGKNVEKSARSPVLWNTVNKALNLKSEMLAMNLDEKNFIETIKILERQKKYIGGAIAAPLKEIAYRYFFDKLGKIEKKTQAINNLYRDESGKLNGFNTDGEAAIKSIINNGDDKIFDNVLLVGTGGVAKAIGSSLTFDNHNFKKIEITGRSKIKVDLISKDLNFDPVELDNLNYEKYDLVINATSVGWNDPKSSIFNLENLRKFKTSTLVFDVIYQPSETKLLSLAKSCGLKVMNGLDMNLKQAVSGFYNTMQVKNYDLKQELIEQLMREYRVK